MKRFTLGLAVSAAVVLGTGLTANATITYDFSTGLQGWTQIYPTTGALWDNYGGWWAPPPPLSDGHLGAGWEEAETQMGRSPEFKLDGSGDLTFQTHGSKSPLAAVGVTPSTVPELAITNGGFCGLALRDVAADTYVLSRGQSVDLYGAFTNLSFTAAELAPYANNGKLYTLDWIDYDKLGGGGWCWLEDVSIPGVLFSHPANDNFVNAINLPGPTGTQTGTDNIAAYLEVGEPNPGTGASNTVWFKWTCPENGDLTVSTLGSTDPGAGEWDAVLGIYSGTALNALTPLGTTPQDTGVPETMTVLVTAGTNYYIQLAGYVNAVAANIVLNWTFLAAIRAEIEAFGPGATISPVVTNAATIAWIVPYGSDLATLAPTFTLSPGATCDQTSGAIPSPNCSAGPVDYTVISSNFLITNVYTVTVTFSPPPPGGVTGLALWLDASKLTGLSDNATVTTWTDMSGLGNNATTSAGTPIYKTGVLGGQPVVRFNGASGFTTADLSSLFPSAATVFIVTTINNDNAYTLVKANPGVDEWWRWDGDGQSYPGFFRAKRLEAYCPMPNSGSHVFAVSSSEYAWEMSIDGLSKGVAGADFAYTGGGALVIGNGSSGGGLNGDIAEVLLYDRVLTPAEADQVGGYLAFKYGLTTSYPTILQVRLDTPANTQGYPTGTSITATATVGEPNATLTDTVTFHTTPLVPSGATVHTVSASTTSPFTAALGTLPAGTYKIYATLVNNDNPPGTATSATNTFTVAAGIPTSTTLISPINPSTYGQNVTFTATVAPPPTGGTVQFYDGASALGSPVAVNTGTGVATYSSPTLGAGTHVISANYSGHWLHGASTSAVLTQVVNQAQLTVKALDALRAPNTANPVPLPYRISGYKNGENLATSGVTGTPTLTTDAVLASPVGTYDIICAVGSLAAANYSFTFVKGTLTVAVLADTFSVNFYVGPNWPYGGLTTDEQKANVLVGPSIPAGFGDWYASGWANIEVPWNPGTPQPAVKLASTGGSSAQFVLQTCRNGWTYNGPRTTLLGDGNGNMMDAHVNSTFDGSEWFDMEVSEIPFGIYDVIFYMGANQAQFGDGTGNIVFNGAERAFTIKPGAFDGTFTEMVDGTTPGNYIVYTGVTGASFTTRTWGNGFNHIGPFGFQIRESATPQANIKTFGPGAVIGPVVANKADIAWTVLYGTDLAHLAPIFTLSPGATCKVGGNTVNSGDTVNFSGGPVDYTVTSSDSTIVNVYTVTVSVAPPSSAKDILTCDIGGTNIAVFKYENTYLKVPAGTSVASLPVNYTVSPGASGAPASGTPRDFTTAQTQTYTITAQDGSTKDYTVTVIVDGPPVLIGHWASGAESLTDSSGYTPAGTHDGVAMGDNAGLLAWSSDAPVGFTGKSLDLSAGSVAVQINNTAANDSAYRTTFDQGIGTKFTTTFWFKGPVDTLTGVWVSKSGNTPYGWKARPLNGTLPVVNVDFTMRDNTGDAPTPSALQTSGVSVNDGAWHHVAEVLDGWNPSFRKVYVDGVLRAQSTGTNNPVNIANLSHLLLGATQGQSPQVPDATIGVPGGFFTGQLYGVRIYNGPLTAAEVDSVYSRRPILTGITGPGPAGFTLQGSTAYAGDLVTMKATSLSPSNWTPVQTNAVPIGSFSITLPQGADPHAFYQLMVP